MKKTLLFFIVSLFTQLIASNANAMTPRKSLTHAPASSQALKSQFPINKKKQTLLIKYTYKQNNDTRYTKWTFYKFHKPFQKNQKRKIAAETIIVGAPTVFTGGAIVPVALVASAASFIAYTFYDEKTMSNGITPDYSDDFSLTPINSSTLNVSAIETVLKEQEKIQDNVKPLVDFEDFLDSGNSDNGITEDYCDDFSSSPVNMDALESVVNEQFERD